MAYDSKHGQVVLFGGLPGFNDTWLWDGTNWTMATPQTSPAIRASHAMAYDSKHGQVVLFGGFTPGSSGILGDTWVWDGTNWTEMSPATSPPGRYGHAMAFDVSLGEVILFGGCIASSGCLQNDTWAWDGADWTLLSPKTSPTARYYHAMASDSAHAQIVMFGGEDRTSNQASDTWLWDGSNWAQASPGTAPPGRIKHAMASYSGQGQIILFGGQTFFFSFFNDTWLWDGSNWTQESPQTNPFERSEIAMAYDSDHSQTVMFGGLSGASEGTSIVDLEDTWIFAGPPAAPVISSVVNGASFANGGVVPGEIATLFGTNITTNTGINFTSGLPLPSAFLNDSISVINETVPLFAVDNVNGQQQINFQVPWAVANGPTATVTVTNNNTFSSSISVPVLAAQPGIFNYAVGTDTFGVILHANFQPANTASPAKPGEIVLIYCTGLGAVSSPPADGEPGKGQSTTALPTAMIGGKKAVVSFSGLAPGFVGLNQINVQVPEGLASGNQAVVVTQSSAASNSVLLPVQ